MTREEFAAMSIEDREHFIRSKTPDELEQMDGVIFINIDTNAKTEIGRFLATYSKTPFTHPHYDYFASIEAFWQWLCSGDTPNTRNSDLRPLHGHSAKTKGRQSKWTRIDNFFGEIVYATYVKITSNRDMCRAIAESKLPFVMYYFTKTRTMTIPTPKRRWLIAGIDEIRRHIAEHGISVPYSVSIAVRTMK